MIFKPTYIKIHLFLLFGMLFVLCAFSQTDGVKFGQSYRIHPGNMEQTEVFIVKSPVDPDVMFVSCNTLNFIPFFVSEGIYTTNNGGSSWTGSDTCQGYPIDFHGGDPGITIDQNGTFIITRLGRSPFSGLYSHYSEDQGKSWSAQKVISTDDLERATLATNAFPGTPGYGNTYAGWIKFANPFPLMIAVTGDGGRNWTTPYQLNNPPRRSAGGDIAIGPEGQVYVCWSGVTDVTPFREVYTGFASSVDGGASWSVTEQAFPMNGITGKLDEKGGIRVNGLPGIDVDVTDGPRRGWIYIVTGQKGLAPAGDDPDIVLNRSTDGGKSWSPAIRVNQDALSNGKIQYFPSVHVDKYGTVNVIFYDDRNTASDSTSVFLARSDDGGDTWKEFEISDHRFRPRAIGLLGQGYQGDNIDLTSSNTHLWPVWMDNSTGVYQIYTNPVSFSEINSIPPDKKQQERLSVRLTPNPVTSTVVASFIAPAKGNFRLALTDLYGKSMTVFNESVPNPGFYKKEIDCSGLTPGVYLLQVSGENCSGAARVIRLPD